MESLVLSHKGKKIVYTKTNKGNKSILLPATIDENGKYHKNSIQQDEIGWRISSSIINSEDFSNVWLTDKGKICHNSSENPEITYLDERIDPDKESENPVYCKAQELYEILNENIEKIVAYDNADWTPESVITLRKKQLIAYLKLLGYSSISDIRKKEEPSGEYAALSRVGEKLEEYNGLDFVRRKEGTFFSENFVVDIPEFYSGEECNPEEVLKKYSDYIKTAEEKFQEDLEFVQKRDEELDRSRGIFPDYFLNMKRKINPQEWKTYHLSVIKIAKVVMGLNYDILSFPDREKIPDLTELTEEEVGDKISQLIDDVRFFDTAADIENRYAAKESECFVEKVDELSGSDAAFQMGELAKSLAELKDEALTTRDEKKQKIDSYNKMNNLYEKMTKIIIGTPKDKEE